MTNITEAQIQELIEKAVAERLAAAGASSAMPPDVKMDPQDGSYYREVVVTMPDGLTRIKRRRVMLDPTAAKVNRADYWHPVLGWIVEGYKLEKDRDMQDIMADNSTAQLDPAVLHDSRKKEVS